MQQRQLGQNGPMVGAVGLGCMSFAGVYGGTDEATAHRTLARALELGVTHLDTSNVYGMGKSETFIGSFIKDHPNQFVIATKGGIATKPKRGFNNTEEHLRTELEGSLKRLGVDHVPLYYVHRRQQEIPVEDVIGTLQKFIDEGKIGAIGLSEVAPSTLRRAAAVHPIAAVQSEYSVWTRQPELGILQACREVGATFVAFSPVGRGIFADTLPTRDKFSETDFRYNNPRFVEPNFSANLEYARRFRDYAQAMGVSASTLAIAWGLAQGDNIISIPGTRSPEHLEQDAAAGSVTLTKTQLEEIEAILPIGFAHGDRYGDGQGGVERYC